MLAVLEMIDKENRMIRREGRKEGIRQKTEQVIKEMKKKIGIIILITIIILSVAIGIVMSTRLGGKIRAYLYYKILLIKKDNWEIEYVFR